MRVYHLKIMTLATHTVVIKSHKDNICFTEVRS